MVAILFTLSLVGFSSYGMSLLKAEFKSTDYLNDGTYLKEFFDSYAEQFPNGGISGNIYLGKKTNFYQYMEEISAMLNE